MPGAKDEASEDELTRWSDQRRAAFEHALTQWRDQRRVSDATRDDLVKGALSAGITKSRVHALTGIARTTIDKITGKGSQ